MNKVIFSNKYFYNFDEMFFVTPLTFDWIAWADTFPQNPKVFSFVSLTEAKKHINSFILGGEAKKKNEHSQIILEYECKITKTNESRLKRGYEVSNEMLLKLRPVSINNVFGNG